MNSLPRWLGGTEPACQCRRCRKRGSHPGSGRSPGGRNSNPFEYSCLGHPMNSGAWGLQSMGSQKSQTRLSTSTHTQLQTDTLTPTRALGKDGGSCVLDKSHYRDELVALLVGKQPAHPSRQSLFLTLNLLRMLPWWLRQ